MNRENDKTQISISSCGIKVTCEMSPDSTIDDIMTAFRGMLVSITYPHSLFNDWVIQEADTLNTEKFDN